jgi:hypothetical protein
VHFAVKNKLKLNLYTLLKKHIKETRNISTHFLLYRPTPPPSAISPFCPQCGESYLPTEVAAKDEKILGCESVETVGQKSGAIVLLNTAGYHKGN